MPKKTKCESKQRNLINVYAKNPLPEYVTATFIIYIKNSKNAITDVKMNMIGPPIKNDINLKNSSTNGVEKSETVES